MASLTRFRSRQGSRFRSSKHYFSWLTWRKSSKLSPHFFLAGQYHLLFEDVVYFLCLFHAFFFALLKGWYASHRRFKWISASRSSLPFFGRVPFFYRDFSFLLCPLLRTLTSPIPTTLEYPPFSAAHSHFPFRCFCLVLLISEAFTVGLSWAEKISAVGRGLIFCTSHRFAFESFYNSLRHVFDGVHAPNAV